jgi:hypothetical protein
MADERLLSVDEFLLKLIVTVMLDGHAMTEAEIARAVASQTARIVERRTVAAILKPLVGGIVTVAGVPPVQHRSPAAPWASSTRRAVAAGRGTGCTGPTARHVGSTGAGAAPSAHQIRSGGGHTEIS